jgi:hypothetical protein
MKHSSLFHFIRHIYGAKTSAKQKIIVVLGMDRSGTSLLANVLQALGGNLGDDLMSLNEYNARGYFESNKIVALHNKILDTLGLSWSTPKFLTQIQEDWWRQPAFVPLRDQLTTFLQLQLSGEKPFVFKDPRTARLLPLWNDIFADLDVEPAYVLAVRHPKEVAQSLHRRDAIGPRLAEILWLERYVDSLVYARDRIIAIVNFDDWFEAPGKTARKLAAKLGLSLSGGSSDLDRTISAIVVPELRHHTRPPDDFVLPLTRKLYTALLKGNVKELAALAEVARTSFILCDYAVEYVIGDLDDKLRREEQRAFASSRTLESAVPSRVNTNIPLGENSTVKGFLEFVGKGIVSGWAFDKAAPDDNLIVELFVAGNQRRICFAHHLRTDLEKAGIGKGDHGFRFILIKQLDSMELEQVAVYAVSASGHRILLPRLNR